jgi:hypothetical protein
MVAPIFNFRNVKLTLSTTSATNVYGLTTYDPSNINTTLAAGVLPTDVTGVILTLQCSNTTGTTTSGIAAQTVHVSAMVNNTVTGTTTMLVYNYPVLGNNAFDPLSGNLILGANDVLQVQTDVAGSIDVVVSLLEVANATAS